MRCMSLYKRGGTYSSRIMRGGVTITRSLGVRDKNAARRLEASIITRLAEGKFGLVEPPTFEAFCTDFLNYVVSRVSPATYVAYTKAVTVLTSLPELATRRLDRINAALADRFIDYRREAGDAIETINLRIRVLRRILHVAAERELITKVPRLHGLAGGNQREFVISDTDETLLVEAAVHPTMKDLIPFYAETGLRREEACELLWPDVGDEEKYIQVKDGKTKNSRRRIPLSAKAQAIIRLRKQNRKPGVPFVFTRHEGLHGISPDWATHNFAAARDKAGISKECVLHSTRHTAATRLGNLGVSPSVLQKLFGWSNIMMAMRYCHPDSEQLTKAIERLNK